MADDVVIEDPIGQAYHQSRRQRACAARRRWRAFYDANIGPNQLQGHLRGDVPVELSRRDRPHPGAAHSVPERHRSATVRGMFTYRVNDAGLLTNLRGYWNMDAMQFAKTGEGRLAGRWRAAAPSSSAALAASVWRWPSCSPRRARASSSTDATPTRRPKRPNALPVPCAFPGSPADPAVADALIDSVHTGVRPDRHPGELRGHRGAGQRVDPQGHQRTVPRPARRPPRHDVRDLPRRGAAHGRAGWRIHHQHQLVRFPRRLRRNRLSGRQGRGQRVDDGDRRRTEGARRARERGVPGREDAAVDGSGVRGPHRRVEPPRLIGRGEHAGRARRSSARVRRADVRLPRQRSRQGRHGSDLHRRRRFRRPLRPLHRRQSWDIATTTTRRRGRSTRSTR